MQCYFLYPFPRDKKVTVRINRDGVVTWQVNAFIVSECEIVVEYYPFDTQVSECFVYKSHCCTCLYNSPLLSFGYVFFQAWHGMFDSHILNL